MSISALAAVVASLALSGGPALAAAPNDELCDTEVSAPTYQAGTIIYSGGVRCVARADITVTVELEMDGSLVADTENSCDAFSCFDTGFYPNRSGNQRWCTVVRAVNLVPARRCENAGF
ncbi:hypothetical protein ABZ612_36455 [Streptomyces avermitilis]|uniref:hypothetical protein n=1 Tax=Streptomyces avermitilis TaxID=33903 RepID=UPI0033F34C80